MKTLCFILTLMLLTPGAPSEAQDRVHFDQMHYVIDISGSIPDEQFEGATDRLAALVPEQAMMYQPVTVIVTVIGDDFQLFSPIERVFHIPFVDSEHIRQVVHEEGAAIGIAGKSAFDNRMLEARRALIDTLTSISQFITGIRQDEYPCSAIEELFQTRIPSRGLSVLTQIVTDLNSTCADTAGLPSRAIAPTLVYYVPSKGDGGLRGSVLGHFDDRSRQFISRYPGTDVISAASMTAEWERAIRGLLFPSLQTVGAKELAN